VTLQRERSVGEAQQRAEEEYAVSQRAEARAVSPLAGEPVTSLQLEIAPRSPKPLMQQEAANL
jgi:hypothetical protein